MNKIDFIILILSFLTGYVCIALYTIWSVLDDIRTETKEKGGKF